MLESADIYIHIPIHPSIPIIIHIAEMMWTEDPGNTWYRVLLNQSWSTYNKSDQGPLHAGNS